MNRLLLMTALAAAAYFAFAPDLHMPGAREMSAPSGVSQETEDSQDTRLEEAYTRHLSGLQVTGQGTVVKVLRDDENGSRHQRFIVRLDSGRTVLVAHNIDLAPRIDALRAGDAVTFSGEYEWNPKGGVIHWTHHDPRGRHPAGWIRHDGQLYQ